MERPRSHLVAAIRGTEGEVSSPDLIAADECVLTSNLSQGSQEQTAARVVLLRAGGLGEPCVGPGGDADAVACTVGENPAFRSVSVMDDASSGSERCRDPALGVLACDGHIDVHRVAEWFVRVQVLHPDR